MGGGAAHSISTQGARQLGRRQACFLGLLLQHFHGHESRTMGSSLATRASRPYRRARVGCSHMLPLALPTAKQAFSTALRWPCWGLLFAAHPSGPAKQPLAVVPSDPAHADGAGGILLIGTLSRHPCKHLQTWHRSQCSARDPGLPQQHAAQGQTLASHRPCPSPKTNPASARPCRQ